MGKSNRSLKFYWFAHRGSPDTEFIVNCDIRQFDQTPTVFYYRAKTFLQWQQWRNNIRNVRTWWTGNNNANRKTPKLKHILTKGQFLSLLFYEML